MDTMRIFGRWRQGAAVLLVGFVLGGCSGNTPIVGPDPAAIEMAKSRGGQEIDPTHRDAGELYALKTIISNPPAVSGAASPIKATPGQNPAKQRTISAVAVLPVTGAPGNGNAELTTAMREVLRDAGWPVRTTPGAEALSVQGQIELGRADKGVQPVSLAWTVSDPSGKVLGSIGQRNIVPAGSIDRGFGANARIIALAASSGIFDLVRQVKEVNK